MKYAWGYSAKWIRNTSTGALGVRVRPPKQCVMEFIIIDGQLSGGVDRNFDIYVNLDGDIVTVIYLEDESTQYIRYPNEDYLKAFKYYKGRVLLFDNDNLEFYCAGATVGTYLFVSFRALMSVYGIPSVESIEVGGTPANCTLDTEYANRILGVMYE